MKRFLSWDGTNWTSRGGVVITAGDRDDLVLGVDKPNSTTTGVPAGVTLTPQTSGAITAGSTYTEIDFQYQVVLPANQSSPINFVRCKFSGPAAGFTGTEGLIKAFNTNHAPAVCTDSTFRPTTPTCYANGVHGGVVDLIRCDISYVVDGASAWGAGGTVQQCYIHDHAWFPESADPPLLQADGNHNDCAQIQGGSGWNFLGNAMEGYNAPEYIPNFYGSQHANAVMIISPDVSAITNVVIEDNWMEGGAVVLNFANGSFGNLGTVGRVWRNKIVRNSTRVTGDYFYLASPGVVDWGGTGADANRFTDDNSVVPVG